MAEGLKLAENATNLVIGALAVATGSGAVQSVAIVVGATRALIEVARALTGPAKGDVAARARQSVLATIQALPEFRGADLDRAAALLADARFDPFSPQVLADAVARTGAAGPARSLAPFSSA